MSDTAAGGLVARIYSNLVRLLGGKAISAVIGLAYMVVATRSLGPTDYGVLVLVHTFAMTVGGIVEFPGWHAIVRYGAQALAEDDHPRLMRLLRFAAIVEGAAGVASIASAALLAPILGPRLGWSPTAIAFALPYSFAVLSSIRATPAGYLQLLGRFDLLGLHNIVAPGVRLIGALIVAWAGFGLKGFLIAWLVAALAEWAVMWMLGIVAVRRTVRDPQLLGTVRGALKENPGLWRFMLAANADVTLTELAARIPPLFVGWTLGPAAAGLYAVAQRAAVVIQQPAQIMGQAAYAELARLVANGGTGAQLKAALIRCASVALAVATPVILILAFAGRQVAIALGGHAFASAGGLILLLGIGRAAWLAAPPASAALTALGKPQLSVAANFAINLGLLPLLPLMMMAFGLAGAGCHGIIQGAGASLLLLALVMHQTREHAAPRDGPLMRIAYVINSLEGGGAAGPVPAVAGVLQSQGCEVQIWALTARDKRALPAIEQAGLPVEIRDGGETDHIAAVRWLDRQVMAWQPDLIWTSLTRATLIGQIVGQMNDTDVVSWQHSAYLKTLNFLLLRLRQKRSLLWIADSHKVADLTESRLKVERSRIAVWPLFSADANALQATPWQQGQTIRIGSLGRLHTNKGYDILIAALQRLRANGFTPPAPFRVEIAGEGAQRGPLEAQAREAGVSEIEFIGFSKAHAFLAGLHLYVQPSRREGLCIAAHEAMQAGLPVIGSETGEMPYTIVDGVTGRVVPPLDPDALAGALAELLCDPAGLAAIGQASRNRVLSKFGGDTFADAGINALERVRLIRSGRPARSRSK